MSDFASLHFTVAGRVQGVYFRAFTLRQATKLGLTGYVRNLPGGESVEVRAEGERHKLEELVEHLKIGPPGARIEDIKTNWSEFTGIYSGFTIKY